MCDDRVSAEAMLPALSPEVVRAMARWPDVPAAYGWLRLDRRGRWLLDGSVVNHAGLCAFFAQHYRVDARGAWYVQNGPQRAYVTLDYTPWVLRHLGDGRFVSHTGQACAPPRAAYVDDDGQLLLMTELGIGLVDARDLTGLIPLFGVVDEQPQCLCIGGRQLPLHSIARTTVAARFGFVAAPVAAAATR